jgi:uncharacterized protein YoxC
MSILFISLAVVIVAFVVVVVFIYQSIRMDDFSQDEEYENFLKRLDAEDR